LRSVALSFSTTDPITSSNKADLFPWNVVHLNMGILFFLSLSFFFRWIDSIATPDDSLTLFFQGTVLMRTFVDWWVPFFHLRNHIPTFFFLVLPQVDSFRYFSFEGEQCAPRLIPPFDPWRTPRFFPLPRLPLTGIVSISPNCAAKHSGSLGFSRSFSREHPPVHLFLPLYVNKAVILCCTRQRNCRLLC